MAEEVAAAMAAMATVAEDTDEEGMAGEGSETAVRPFQEPF